MGVEEKKNNDEIEIKRAIDGLVEALHAKNIDGVMSIYAPELVSFDLVPPLRYLGADAHRKQWLKGWSSIQGPFGHEIADLDITVGDDVAFTHSLNRVSVTLNTGQKFEYWHRATMCFRKIEGKWLMVHEHVSVPFDMQAGRALLDLKP